MFRAGLKIGPFILIRPLGRGSHGEVWLARRDVKCAPLVAVKLPYGGRVNYAAVEREAKLWKLGSGHPNVLPLAEAHEYDGQVVIVSEYAPDGTLEELILRNGGSLPPRRAVNITIGILTGLGFLHSRQIIHRDLKPANVMMQCGVPRLGDFGVSRMVRATSITATIEGTPGYMAPEAFQGNFNERTDIWPVAVMLYRMVAGRLPFPKEPLHLAYHAVKESDPAPLPDSLPPRLSEIIWKALSKDAAARYQTAREMREELEELWRVLPEAPAAPAPALPASEDSTRRRNSFAHGDAGSHDRSAGPAAGAKVVPAPPRAALRILATAIRHYVVASVGLLTLLALIWGGHFIVETYTKSDPGTAAVGTHIGRDAGVTPAVTTSSVRAAEGYIDRRLNVINGKYYFKDMHGNVAPHVFSTYSPSNLDGGLVRMKLDNMTAVVVRATGVIVFPLGEYKDDEDFAGGLTLMKMYGKWGFLDRDACFTIPPLYDDARRFSEGFAAVKVGGKWGFINNKGDEKVPPKYDDALPFSEGFAAVKVGDKWGFINSRYAEVITAKYEDVRPFSEGLAGVKLREKWGFINTGNKLVIPATYLQVQPFKNGSAQVTREDGEAVINSFGKVEP